MNIDYKKFFLNSNYIDFIVKASLVTILFNICTLLFFMSAFNSFENKINSKYSYEVVKYYFKGTVINPVAFIKSADTYRLSGRPEKELEDLQFALGLYLNMAQKDSETIQILKQRIKILELKEKIEN
jgi:hypothetical protein